MSLSPNLRGGLGEFKSNNKETGLKDTPLGEFSKALESKQQDKSDFKKDEIAKNLKDALKEKRTLSDELKLRQKENKEGLKAEKSSGAEERRKSEAVNKEKPDEEKTTEAKKETKTKGGTKKTAGGRERAIQKFMDSIESEFSIPPTRIVEAMAQLNNQELKQSPEQTEDQVIQNLGLTGEDALQAKSMYSDLLKDLSTVDSEGQPQIVINRPGELFASQTQSRHLSALEQKDQIRSSLDKMNEKFWMKNGLANESQVTALDNNSEVSDFEGLNSQFSDDFGADNQLNGFSNEQFEKPVQYPNAEVDPKTKIGVTGASAMTVSNQSPEMKKLMEEMKALQAQKQKLSNIKNEINQTENEGDTEEDSESSLGVGISNENATFGSEGNQFVKSSNSDMKNFSDSNGNQNLQSQNQQDFYANSVKGNNQNERSAKSEINAKDSGKDSKATSSGSESSFGSLLSSLTGAKVNVSDLNNLKITPAHVGATGAALAAMSPEDEKANIQEVMSKAQYLVKRGGGEVQVKMNPEGLGTINLKLDLQDGKVNVQMTAESNEAKRILEDSVKELKNHLSAHKLSVDHIKVDVVSNPAESMNSNNNMNSDTQRESARQFWNQYRENFGNPQRRDGYFDIPNMSSYAKKLTNDPQIPSLDSSARAPRSIEGKGSEINMVA